MTKTLSNWTLNNRQLIIMINLEINQINELLICLSNLVSCKGTNFCFHAKLVCVSQ